MELETASRVARATMKMDWNVDRNGVWDWGAGVALYGLCRYWRRTGDVQTLHFLRSFADRGMAMGELPKTVNTTAPLLTLLALRDQPDGAAYLPLCDSFAAYLLSDAPRTASGALEHTVLGNVFGGQVWVDTIFMAGVFLTRAGLAMGNEECIAEGVRQAMLHLELLHDDATALFYHGRDTLRNNFLSGCLWARGNSWVSVAVPDLFEGLDGFAPEREHAFSLVADQLEAVRTRQREDGLWPTVLTDGQSYPETSASAGFVYGMCRGRHLGYLDGRFDAAIRLGMAGLCSRIRPDGIVTGVSAGTGIQKSIAAYDDVPHDASMPWGQGLALLALCEDMPEA